MITKRSLSFPIYDISVTLHVNFYRPQRSWGKVMFLQASVILLTGGVSASVHAGIPHPLGADTPPPQADIPPPRADTPPSKQTPPQEQTPPGADPPEQTPTRADPPRSRHPPGSRHPPRCRACWEIRSTRGRYTSYWNAILFLKSNFLGYIWGTKQRKNSCVTQFAKLDGEF